MDLRKKNLIFVDSFLNHMECSDCQLNKISDTVTVYFGKTGIISPGIENIEEDVKRSMKNGIKKDLCDYVEFLIKTGESVDELMEAMMTFGISLDEFIKRDYEFILNEIANMHSKTLTVIKKKGDSIKVLCSTCYPGPEGNINEIFTLDNTEITNLLNSKVILQDKIKGNEELLAIKLHEGLFEMFGEELGLYLDGILDSLN